MRRFNNFLMPDPKLGNLESLLTNYLVTSGLALAFCVTAMMSLSHSDLQADDMFTGLRDNAPCYNEGLCVCAHGVDGFRDYVVNLAQSEMKKHPDEASNFELTYSNHSLNAVEYIAEYKGCVPLHGVGIAVAPPEMDASIYLLVSQLPRHKLVAFMKVNHIHFRSSEHHKYGMASFAALTSACLGSLGALFAMSQGRISESSEKSNRAAEAFAMWFTPVMYLLYILMLFGLICFFIQLGQVINVIYVAGEIRAKQDDYILAFFVIFGAISTMTFLALAMACRARSKSQVPQNRSPGAELDQSETETKAEA